MKIEASIMHDDLYGLRNAIFEGDAQKARDNTEMVLKLGYSTTAILENALFPAMKVIGERLCDQQIYIPDVLMSARAMQGAMYVLKPIMSVNQGPHRGTVVIGTVAGDLHDIGKNLVLMMLQGKGFSVIDLGIDVTAEDFVDAIKRYNPDIVAMSSLLTTTLPELKVVIDAIVEEGLRPQVTIMVGGAPVTKSYAREIKADIYADSMFEAGEAAEHLAEHKISKYVV